jgi:hypothetical protein
MNERQEERAPAPPRGYEGHRVAQAGIGLAMTPSERLRWLQETMEVLRRWQGRACNDSGRPSPD